MELAERNSREFRPTYGSGTRTTISVNKVNSGDSGNNRQPDAKCSRCSDSINMEVDTVADFSIMSRDTYIKRFKSFPLQNTDVKLKTYSGETLRTCGQMLCKVVYSGQEYILPIIVAENEGKPTLLGRNWLENIKVNWNEVFSLNGTLRNEVLDCIINKHADLFREGYDGMKGIEAHIRGREQVQFTASRALPRMH